MLLVNIKEIRFVFGTVLDLYLGNLIEEFACLNCCDRSLIWLNGELVLNLSIDLQIIHSFFGTEAHGNVIIDISKTVVSETVYQLLVAKGVSFSIVRHIKGNIGHGLETSSYHNIRLSQLYRLRTIHDCFHSGRTDLWFIFLPY